MKKTQVALAALALVASSAVLADVTMYGNIDAGYFSLSETGAKTGVDSGAQSGFAGAGGTAPNFWGLKGTEDLGDGLKANFNLEGQFSSSTGQGDNSDNGQGASMALAPSGQLFGRAANVGLSGDFGTVTLGQQIDPGFLALASVDPRGVKMSFSALLAWFPNAGVSGGLVQGIFDSGMVSYTTPTTSGFTAQVGASRPATYNGDSDNTSSRANNMKSGRISFTQGALSLSAGMTDSYNAAGLNNMTATVVGGGYNLGELTLKGFYVKYDNRINSTKVTQYGFGGNYDLGNGISMDAAYYDTKQDVDSNNKSQMAVVGIEKALSKRTALYAHVATMSTGTAADASTSLMLAGNGAGHGPGIGQDARAYGIGIRHSF